MYNKVIKCINMLILIVDQIDITYNQRKNKSTLQAYLSIY